MFLQALLATCYHSVHNYPTCSIASCTLNNICYDQIHIMLWLSINYMMHVILFDKSLIFPASSPFFNFITSQFIKSTFHSQLDGSLELLLTVFVLILSCSSYQKPSCVYNLPLLLVRSPGHHYTIMLVYKRDSCYNITCNRCSE